MRRRSKTGETPSTARGSPPPRRGLRPWLLVVDVDETLFGDDSARARLLDALAEGGSTRLALDSSRPVSSVQATLAAAPPHVPWDAIIGALGTEIAFAAQDGRIERRPFPGFDRAAVDDVLTGLGFRPHPPALQTPSKVSYVVPSGAALRRAREALGRLPFPHCIIHSGASDLDVLPEGAGKALGLAEVAARLGVEEGRIVAAGDALPDAPMLEAAAFGIIVGNARDELRARPFGPRVLRAQAAFAGGIEEGLVRLGLLGADPATDPFDERAAAPETDS